MVKLLSALLVFFLLTSTLFAYPVKEDTFLSIKDYDIALSGVIDTWSARANYITDIHERTLFIVFLDCLVICHEILNSACHLILAEKPDIPSLKTYCRERTRTVESYIKMLQGATNIQNQEAYNTALKTLNNTKRALNRMESEL